MNAMRWRDTRPIAAKQYEDCTEPAA